jgi:hypothetical protein
MDTPGLNKALGEARAMLRSFEHTASQAGAMHTFYQGIDHIDAYRKDSRYMRYSDRIMELRRAFSRGLLRQLHVIPSEDMYLASMCLVLLKNEIADITVAEPAMAQRCAEFRRGARTNPQTKMLLALMAQRGHGEAPFRAAAGNE